MNKKLGEHPGLFIVLILFSITFVSAGPVEGLRILLEGARDMIILFGEFIRDVILDLEHFDEFFVAKFIYALIIFIVTYSVLVKQELISEKRGTNRLIAILIAILAIRFTPDNDFVNSMLLPYGVFGAAVTTFLPFAVFYYFVHERIRGSIIRRSAWIFFGTFFVGMWWMRSNSGGLSEAVGYIYLIAFGLILLFIILDKPLHKVWGLRDINRFLTGAGQKSIVKLQAEYLRIIDVDTRHAENRRKFIKKKLRELGGEMP